MLEIPVDTLSWRSPPQFAPDAPSIAKRQLPPSPPHRCSARSGAAPRPLPTFPRGPSSAPSFRHSAASAALVPPARLRRQGRARPEPSSFRARTKQHRPTAREFGAAVEKDPIRRRGRGAFFWKDQAARAARRHILEKDRKKIGQIEKRLEKD